MKQIETITSQARQNFYVISDSGKKIEFKLYFLPTQASWFVDITCETFSANGLRVCRLPNILDKFRNIIDFGVAVYTKDGLDPWRINDFESGYAVLLLLNEEEKKELSEELDGKNQ